MTEGVGRRIVTLMRARGELQDESARGGLYLPDIGEPEEAACGACRLPILAERTQGELRARRGPLPLRVSARALLRGLRQTGGRTRAAREESSRRRSTSRRRLRPYRRRGALAGHRRARRGF